MTDETIVAVFSDAENVAAVISDLEFHQVELSNILLRLARILQDQKDFGKNFLGLIRKILTTQPHIIMLSPVAQLC
jgi:hypothetical protein